MNLSVEITYIEHLKRRGIDMYYATLPVEGWRTQFTFFVDHTYRANIGGETCVFKVLDIQGEIVLIDEIPLNENDAKTQKLFGSESEVHCSNFFDITELEF